MSEIEPVAQDATTENNATPVTTTHSPVTGDEEWKKFLAPPKEAITPGDLQTCCAIIQMSSKAGVFTPSDFKAVGALYEKLSEYVQHIRAKDIETALKSHQASTSTGPNASATATETDAEQKKD